MYGDEVSVGDLLVEGVFEEQYTGLREVNSDADIYISKKFEKEKEEPFIQEISERTGKFEKNVEIYIKNFKIFFNKGVPKFKNCDTIRADKKMKLFSNYYIPIKIVEITNFETEKITRKYTENELIEKITKELQSELKEEIDIENPAGVKTKVNNIIKTDSIKVKIECMVEEKIGTKE